METRLQRRRRPSKMVIRTNKAARPPPQMSWEEVEGGGKRKGEGGRGQVSNPEPERGDTQMLADGMQRMAERKLHLTV